MSSPLDPKSFLFPRNSIESLKKVLAREGSPDAEAGQQPEAAGRDEDDDDQGVISGPAGAAGAALPDEDGGAARVHKGLPTGAQPEPMPATGLQPVGLDGSAGLATASAAEGGSAGAGAAAASSSLMGVGLAAGAVALGVGAAHASSRGDERSESRHDLSANRTESVAGGAEAGADTPVAPAAAGGSGSASGSGPSGSAALAGSGVAGGATDAARMIGASGDPLPGTGTSASAGAGASAGTGAGTGTDTGTGESADTGTGTGTGTGAGVSTGTGADTGTGTGTGATSDRTGGAPVADVVPTVSSSPKPAYANPSETVKAPYNKALSLDKVLFAGTDDARAPAAIRITDIQENGDSRDQESALTYRKDGQTVWLDVGDTVDAAHFGTLSWDAAQNTGGFFSFEALGTDGLPIADADQQRVQVEENTLLNVSYQLFFQYSDLFLGTGRMAPYFKVTGITEHEDSNGTLDALRIAGRDAPLAVGDLIAEADYRNVYWDMASNQGGEIRLAPYDANRAPYVESYDNGFEVDQVVVKRLPLGMLPDEMLMLV